LGARACLCMHLSHTTRNMHNPMSVKSGLMVAVNPQINPQCGLV
jgi:hypothetical protein